MFELIASSSSGRFFHLTCSVRFNLKNKIYEIYCFILLFGSLILFVLFLSTQCCSVSSKFGKFNFGRSFYFPEVSRSFDITAFDSSECVVCRVASFPFSQLVHRGNIEGIATHSRVRVRWMLAPWMQITQQGKKRQIAFMLHVVIDSIEKYGFYTRAVDVYICVMHIICFFGMALDCIFRIMCNKVISEMYALLKDACSHIVKDKT